MSVVLYVNFQNLLCGICQYGRETYEIIRQSRRHEFVQCEVSSPHAFLAMCQSHRPTSVIINSHPFHRWLDAGLMHRAAQEQWDIIGKTIRFAGTIHDGLPPEHTLSAIVDTDPTALSWPGRFVVSRPIPAYTGSSRPPGDKITVGSFGFGYGDKGFTRLAQKVREEFGAGTRLRLHITRADYATDIDGLIAEIRTAADGLDLEMTHHYLQTPELLDFLAGNDINAFFYGRMFGRGISSVIDMALAVDRPLAITDSWMFRHIIDAKPRIHIEGGRTLKQILDTGPDPVRQLRNLWSHKQLASDYDRVADYLENL